jgi:membrane fusion protein (multidrug efflux system)
VIVPDSSGQSRAQLRPVRVGSVGGDTVLLHEGVRAGEQVAVAGSFKLRDGALVAVAPADPAAAGRP